LVAFFAVVVVLGSINAPQEQKTAEETKCVASSLANTPLVNGLGQDVKIPLFPDAKRFSFADIGASQYSVKAQDVEILSFYTDRMASLCWQVKEQKQNQVVYSQGDKTVRVSLLTNPSGKTVIDYVVLSPEGVLGTVKIAQASCTSDQTYCNGGCVAMGTSCPPPTDASSCTGGTIWCPSSSGSGGWCQMPPCPSSSSTTSPSYTPPSSGTCSGSYQAPGATSPSCNWSMCSNGCTWDATGCPNGCMNSSGTSPTESAPSSGTNCPVGQYTCGSACIPNGAYCAPPGGGTGTNCQFGQYMCNGTCVSNGAYCPPSGGASTGNSGGGSCPSGQYMCNGACMPNSSNCSSTSWPTDATSCASQGKSWCAPASGGSGWCQTGPCPTTSPAPTTPTPPPPTTVTCTSGYTWCSYTQSCVNRVQPCAPLPGQTPTTQQSSNNQPMNCAPDQRFCPSSNTCIPMDGMCGGGTSNQGYGNQYQQGQYQPGGPGDQYGQGPGMGQNMGPSEEEQQKMQEKQFQQMKKGTDQFAKGVTQMQKFVAKMKTTLAKSGVGIPAELTNALAKAPELVAKLKASKDMDEFQELMGDMQDIGMIMQDWGPKLGELQRLASMIKNLDKDIKNMRTNFTRVQKAAKKRPELAEPLIEAETMFSDMTKRVAEIKELAKTDPESAMDLVDEFYGNTEEFWNQISFLDMVSNMTKGLTQANTQIKQIETKIRAMAKAKGADQEMIATLKEMVAAVKAALPELKAAMAVRPVDYEEVKMLAEDFWMQLQDLQNMMADEGQSFYMPNVQQGQGINVNIPEGFIGSLGGGGQAGIITPGGDPGSP